MWKVELALTRILGVKPAWMRPPYGNYNDLVRQASLIRNQSLVIWDFDDGDSVGATVAQSEQDYTDLANRHPNNVLALNHETYKTTAYVLPDLIGLLNLHPLTSFRNIVSRCFRSRSRSSRQRAIRSRLLLSASESLLMLRLVLLEPRT